MAFPGQQPHIFRWQVRKTDWVGAIKDQLRTTLSPLATTLVVPSGWQVAGEWLPFHADHLSCYWRRPLEPSP